MCVFGGGGQPPGEGEGRKLKVTELKRIPAASLRDTNVMVRDPKSVIETTFYKITKTKHKSSDLVLQ